MRENYNIRNYGKGSRKKIKDRVVREKYPNAAIYTLIASEKLEKSERLLDNILGFFTDLPFGIPDFIKGVKNLDKEFYLVEEDESQTIVMITDEFIEANVLSEKIDKSKFEFEGFKFIKCRYEVK